jgi:hypothetical protein
LTLGPGRPLAAIPLRRLRRLTVEMVIRCRVSFPVHLGLWVQRWERRVWVLAWLIVVRNLVPLVAGPGGVVRTLMLVKCGPRIVGAGLGGWERSGR